MSDEISVDPELLKRQLIKLETTRVEAEWKATRMRRLGYEQVPVRMWRGVEIIDLDHPGQVIGYAWRKRADTSTDERPRVHGGEVSDDPYRDWLRAQDDYEFECAQRMAAGMVAEAQVRLAKAKLGLDSAKEIVRITEQVAIERKAGK